MSLSFPDVKSDFGAVGNGSTNDSRRIQDAIDAAYGSGFGGNKVLFPPGRYFIPDGITVKGAVTLDGAGRTCCLLETGGANAVDGVTFDATCNYAGARDLSVYGNNGAGGKAAVKIADNAPVNLSNLNIFGGYNALFTGGVDGYVENCFVSTPHNANVVSVGSNWYVRCKFDVAGAQAPAFSFYQSRSFGGAVISENHFTQCDFTGEFRARAIEVNDLGTHKSVIVIDGGVIGGIAVMTSALWLSLNQCELGPDIINNDPVCSVDVMGCFGMEVTALVKGHNVNITGGHNVVKA